MSGRSPFHIIVTISIFNFFVMKRSFSILVAGLLLMILSVGNSHGQIITSSVPVLSGCVGACGSSYSGSFTSSTDRTYKFKAVSSLCPNHDAYAAIYVNGSLAWSGPIHQGAEAKFEAKAGHDVLVIAGIYPNGKPIECVWLGEVNFAVF